jgi:hypothetical protein
VSKLTSHEKYILYKRCLELGVPDDIAVKIREQATSTLSEIFSSRFFATEVEEIVYAAFFWEHTEEGEEFWIDFLDNFTSRGEKYE